MMETPKEALTRALDHRIFCGPDEIPHHESLEAVAADILDDLKKEGGWELVRIIPKSTPFHSLYPPGTK